VILIEGQKNNYGTEVSFDENLKTTKAGRASVRRNKLVEKFLKIRNEIRKNKDKFTLLERYASIEDILDQLDSLQQDINDEKKLMAENKKNKTDNSAQLEALKEKINENKKKIRYIIIEKP
jgi:hypothetical protein